MWQILNLIRRLIINFKFNFTVRSGFINPETREDIKTCKAAVFGTFRKNFGLNKYRLRYSCSWKYIENGEFNCNTFSYNTLGSTISQANRGCRL